jgi:hypothetical protein
LKKKRKEKKQRNEVLKTRQLLKSLPAPTVLLAV